MNSTIQSGESQLIGFIERKRTAIVRAALNRSLPPERHTILADSLINRTLDYLLMAMSEANEQPLIDWVEGNLLGLAREQSLFNVFAAAVSASIDAAMHDSRHLDPATYRWLEDVQRAIDLTVGVSRLGFYDERFSLDSIDAKIDEVLYELSERDTTTAEHSRSVGLWCWRIAKRMKLTRDETLLAFRSGLIHDIGKIRTPLEILTAPRGLDEAEWAIMRQHTIEGVKTLEAIPELRAFVPAVRWHHERIDGRGYPDGLEGWAIPLTARIVSVADAFNAMVARRPYRKPLSPLVAVEELKRHSDTHFDSSIIKAMIDVVSL